MVGIAGAAPLAKLDVYYLGWLVIKEAIALYALDYQLKVAVGKDSRLLRAGNRKKLRAKLLV